MFASRIFSSLLFSTTLIFSSVAFASTIDEGEDIDQKDIQALREWLNTKRQVTVRELGGALSVSGEVRPEFQTANETVNGIRQRGAGSATGRPVNAFDIEVNLMLDYRTERSWAAIKIEFDNDAGIISGTLNKLKVERAYWAVRAVDTHTTSFDIEIGRRRASSICDSKLEFDFFFDGIWFKYDESFENIADFYIHAGPFLINDFNNHYGYLGEIGLMSIANTGFYTKYSIVDWDTKHLKKSVDRDRYRFVVNQLLLGYRFYPESFQKVILLYAAGLYNPVAKKLPITGHRKVNWGGFAGFSIGELKKQWDWAFDINYQVLQAQCIPDFDNAGVGLGNASGSGFYTSPTIVGGKTVFTPNTQKTAGGNVNYRGFFITLDWLLLNQLDVQQSWLQGITLDDSIGPFRRYKQYEIEFIYSW